MFFNSLQHFKKNLNLYITYDGLLDPLGQSQILPYLINIALNQNGLCILSFEKKERFLSDNNKLKEKLAAYSIIWIPLIFTKRFYFLGKVWDLFRMYFFAILISYLYEPKIVHARGHISAQVSLLLKNIFGLKYIFDFRGLWVDERVDKGGWNLNNYIHRLQYKIFKNNERKILKNADHIVVLTNAVVKEVINIGSQFAKNITVIPCCADFEHFILANYITRNASRKKLNIPEDSTILGYLGSVGSMYLISKFFKLVQLAINNNDNIYVLALTQDKDLFINEMNNYLPVKYHSIFTIISANRDEVAELLPAIDILVAFTKPSYAKISMSPTKMAESFACGIPIISNYGVGDVETITNDLDGGIIIDVDSEEELEHTAINLKNLTLKGGIRLRKASRRILGLEVANSRYLNIYIRLQEQC